MAKRNDFIQIARVISAVAVLSVHFGQAFNVNGVIGRVLNLGQYGLYVFFILSGYLASTSVFGGGDTWIRKKIVRLLPMYYLVLLFYIIVHELILKNVPADSLYLGWLRFVLGVNSLLPADAVFWKSIHAVWYVSTVWIFYILYWLFSEKIRSVSILGWYLAFSLSLAVAIIINQNDPMASTNFFCFLQYFILGIIAQKYQNEKHIILLPICGMILYLIYRDWLTTNVLISCVFCVLIAKFKNYRIYVSNAILKRVIKTADECSYALFLLHPIVIDFVIPFLREYVTNNMYVVAPISMVILVIIVPLAHYKYEVVMQEMLRKRLKLV